MKSIIFILSVIILLTSCEQIIDIDFNENTSKIVIEGSVTNDKGPYFVKITRSTALKDLSQVPIVVNAEVTIVDDLGKSEKLTSIGDGTYKTQNLQGEPGRKYTLEVKVDGKIYTAHSKMPDLVTFDSIKVVPNVFAGETDYDLIPVFTDPISSGDNYRFLLEINGELYENHFIVNDQVENGSVNKQPLKNLFEVDLKPGDVVSIQMQKIDKNVGLYFMTLVLNFDAGPGGGTTPSNPPNNISNDALGIFSAHTVQQRSAVIK